MAALAPSPVPSHRIHSIFDQFAAMRTGQVHSASIQGHNHFLFAPASRAAPPPPPGASTPRRGSKSRSSSRHSAQPIPPTSAPARPAPPPKRPSLQRGVPTTPVTVALPPPPYSVVETEDPFADADIKLPPPPPVRSVSPPSYSYAATHAAAADIVRKLAKEERERRAHTVASLLLVRAQRSARPLRRSVRVASPAPSSPEYVRSGLSSMVSVGADVSDEED